MFNSDIEYEIINDNPVLISTFVRDEEFSHVQVCYGSGTVSNTYGFIVDYGWGGNY